MEWLPDVYMLCKIMSSQFVTKQTILNQNRVHFRPAQNLKKKWCHKCGSHKGQIDLYGLDP